jgi:isochorismate pyruvate lyase
MQPDDATSLTEVRAEIDRLDRALVQLLGERAQWVHAAARFKSSVEAVADPSRQQSMIAGRRVWAEEAGLSADFVESLFRSIVAHFIEREREHWSKLQGRET